MEDLLKEIRRQGKAAVAAQAAAEACLHAVEALVDRLPDRPHSEEAVYSEEAVHLLEALLPVFDALDRASQRSNRRLKTRREKWLHRFHITSDSESLGEGIRLVRAQLDTVLKGLDIEVDRRVDVPFDPRVHRAVEVRYQASTPTPTVIEVVAAGYIYQGRRLREADVVVAQSKENESL